MMKFGLSTLSQRAFTSPDAYVAVAGAAEAAGFDFLSVSDHLSYRVRGKPTIPTSPEGLSGARSKVTVSINSPQLRSSPPRPQSFGYWPR